MNNLTSSTPTSLLPGPSVLCFVSVCAVALEQMWQKNRAFSEDAWAFLSVVIPEAVEAPFLGGKQWGGCQEALKHRWPCPRRRRNDGEM